VAPLDIDTRYYSDLGVPLLRAAQVAGLCGVKLNTVRKWVERGRLEVAGLDDEYRQLFDSSAAAALCRPLIPA
jgi:hypothetical protein